MFTFPKPDLEEFYRAFSVRCFTVADDETQLAYATNLNGKYDVWALDLPHTYPYPLTHQGQVPDFIKFDKNNRFLLVGFDHDGDENTQIYALSRHGGALLPVREAEKKRHYFGALSQDGEHLYYTSDKDNASHQTLYRFNLSSEDEEVLVDGTYGNVYFETLSPEEDSFVYLVVLGNTHIQGFVHKEGTSIPIMEDLNEVFTITQVEYVDQDNLLFVTNYHSPFSYLATYHIPSRTLNKLFAPSGQDVCNVGFHELSRTVYVTAACGVEDTLYEGVIDKGEFEPIDFPGAILSSITVKESGNMYASIYSEDKPANIYRRTPAGEWTQLTNHKVMGTVNLPKAETVTYQSFDSRSIEALLYHSPADTSNGHVIVMPHGGPQHADRKMFWAFTQFLLSQGYSIFSPNFRGSTGYGAEFVKLVERDWGGGPRRDILAGIDWLVEQGHAKRDKLFVLGGSYGGYMTLLLHGRHADYFRAAVDICGPSNLFTFIDSVPESWKPMMKTWVGDPERDREKLIEDSPITYLAGMTKPMLVVQGANDPRVVQAESDQIVETLQSEGREVEYLVMEDEGHGFSKKENELRVYKHVIEFLNKHLSLDAARTEEAVESR